MSTEKRWIFLSDVHNCHINWYGTKTEDRLNRMVEQVNAYLAENPAEGIFILGDVSLDFWMWNEKGCYLRYPPRSNTKLFMNNYAGRLPDPLYLLPGNHEQYGHYEWELFTGYPRSYTVECGGAVFVMLDNFAGIIAPKFHSDGRYSLTDVSVVEKALADYPDKPVFLCAHYFDPAAESEELKTLLRENDRIYALFMGHTHKTAVLELGGKPLAPCGNYSYSGEKNPLDAFWGWRELVMDEEEIRSFYHVPENTAVFGGNTVKIEEHIQDEFRISLK